MDPAALRANLNGDRVDRSGVDRLVGELLDSPNSVKVLLEEIHKGEGSGHFQASWALDHLLRRKPNYLLPHMEQFTLLLPGLKNESCIRCLFHVCEMLCIAAFKQKQRPFREGIDRHQWERIKDACFDTLIGPMGMAPKVFAMGCLYYLGQIFPWVHHQLRGVLEETYATGSIGYRNRAKKTLALLAPTAP